MTPNSEGKDPLASSSGKPLSQQRAFLGLFDRRERWSLSGRGWFVLMAVGAASSAVVFFFIYPFLATTSRTESKILVVEGWIHEYAIRAAVAEFRSNSCERVFSTGGPVTGKGGYINDFNTSASVGAELLHKCGLPRDQIQMVPCRVLERDRTYSSAVALREWFRTNNVPVHAFNVVTEDLHARRSRLLFQKAFGDGVTIGVISVPNIDYDAKRWWLYSEGVKELISETAAYLYVRFFFHPEKP